jgi:beta-N-acetylhexosaminidase
MFNHQVKELSIERKLYQLIISRLNGDDIHSERYREKIVSLVEKAIGGFIIFGGRKNEVRAFIDSIQSISEIPLFIASDVECGVGQQMRDATLFPCQMAMAAAIDKNIPEDVELLQSAVKAIAHESIDIGINMPLLPVLDVNQEPDNPIICTRAFSDNPEDVVWFGSLYIRELEESGLLSCAKHFPGHGDSSMDSHIALPVITKPFEDLITVDVRPFSEAIKTGVSSIMVGHLSVPAIDSKPASLSRKVITDLLRRELCYDGIVLTDALNMKALGGIEKVYTECIKAGADILLHPLDADMVVKELLSAVESKEVGEEQIDRAVNRILKTKAKLRKIKRSEVDYQRHKIISEQITGMSISLVKDTAGLLPISAQNEIHIVLSGERKFFESSPLKTYFKRFSTLTDTRELTNEIALFALFTTIIAWEGHPRIDEHEKNRINKLIGQCRHSIVISFGNPYVLRHFQEADILIAAYGVTEHVQRAVIKCLKGEIGFKGRLPVRLN